MVVRFVGGKAVVAGLPRDLCGVKPLPQPNRTTTRGWIAGPVETVGFTPRPEVGRMHRGSPSAATPGENHKKGLSLDPFVPF